MGRLPDFDYSAPYFYMVTLKAAKGAVPFSRIAGEAAPGTDFRGHSRWLAATGLTRAFAKTIREFAAGREGLNPIETFIVMPDHLHVLFHLRAGGLPLGCHVEALKEALAREYWQVVRGAQGAAAFADSGDGVFEREWHDWIVKKERQLFAFTRYIRENPKRAWLRRQNRRYFSQVVKRPFAGREWFAYGNAALLDLPMLVPFKCSRRWERGDAEWRRAVARAERIGPGGAGVSTFMSPCEKECGNAIFRAGGGLVVLSPEGFAERWHPSRSKEALCAKGRMLFLSLYEPQAGRLDNATLHLRCHEMGDAVQGHCAAAPLPAAAAGARWNGAARGNGAVQWNAEL